MFFELRIKIDAITREVALLITDFPEDGDDEDDVADLWESQVEDLRRVLGA